MALPIPIGIDDFRLLRETRLEYVDKSGLIRDLLDRAGAQVVLFPRPRRFGKSLNLSMLRCWFEKRDEDLSHLFQDLSIWQAGDEYRAHFQRYPVIYLSLKETKHLTFEACHAAIRKKIQVLFDDKAYLLEGGALSERARRDYQAILDGTAEPELYHRALLDLSAHLHAHHGERVLILIDEYDEPIHAGYFNGYANEILDFMRAFLGAALKTNTHLFRAVLTGILRVAMEDPFSGLNIGVYSLLRKEMSTSFGFTEPEVQALLERCGRGEMLESVRGWYNGYLFGGEVLYNPWSVLSFLDSGEADLRPYWLSTSSNDLVRELLQQYAPTLQTVFETLLSGGSIEEPLEENVVMSEIRTSPDALWSLLVFTGYLKAEDAPADDLGRLMYRLSIPNKEVRQVYSTTFRSWMESRAGGHVALGDLTRAVLSGDAERFEERLQELVTNLMSYGDPGTLQPERVYQGFVVGLLAALEPGHQVRSNRESGKGRPDVLIRPSRPGNPGVVLELKVARRGKKTLDEALAEGLAQLRSKDYGAELRAAGAAPVFGFAVAFDGKEVRVRSAEG